MAILTHVDLVLTTELYEKIKKNQKAKEFLEEEALYTYRGEGFVRYQFLDGHWPERIDLYNELEGEENNYFILIRTDDPNDHNNLITEVQGQLRSKPGEPAFSTSPNAKRYAILERPLKVKEIKDRAVNGKFITYVAFNNPYFFFQSTETKMKDIKKKVFADGHVDYDLSKEDFDLVDTQNMIDSGSYFIYKVTIDTSRIK